MGWRWGTLPCEQTDTCENNTYAGGQNSNGTTDPRLNDFREMSINQCNDPHSNDHWSCIIDHTEQRFITERMSSDSSI